MPGPDSSPDYDLLDRLVEEFHHRLRRGERPSVAEYCGRHPHLKDDLLALLPVVAEVEHAKDAPLPNSSRTPTEALPRDFGDFRILREIGRGGMGVVYEAEQVSLGRRVALKMLTRRLLREGTQKRRFEREARSAAKLHHTNIVPVFGVGEHDGTPYYVMQYIRGVGLDAVVAEVAGIDKARPATPATAAAGLALSLVTGTFHAAADGERYEPTRTGPLSPDDAPVAPGAGPAFPNPESVFRPDSSGIASTVTRPVPGGSDPTVAVPELSYWQGVARLGAQAAGALDYAHRQGIIHRDIKPSNLLLDESGTVWVTDFGLAKSEGAADDLTQTGDILGTLRYMAPEAFEGKSDGRSDVYALGLTLYELLALRPAFDERDRNRLIKQVTTGVPGRLSRARRGVPADLDTIVHKAIDRNPARRYQTAGELADDLRRYVDDEPIRARRQSAAEAGWRWARRHPAVAGMAVALAAVAFAGTAAVAWKWREAEANATAAEENARRFREAAEQADRAAADATAAVDQYLNTPSPTTPV